MKKLKKLFQDKLFLTILRCVFSLLLGRIFFLCYYFTHESTYSTISTAFFIPSAILICIGFFSLINHFGGRDFVGYASATTIQFLKRNPEKPFEDLVAYKEYKNGQREFEGPVYLPYFIFGVIYLAVAIIFYILFRKSI